MWWQITGDIIFRVSRYFLAFAPQIVYSNPNTTTHESRSAMPRRRLPIGIEFYKEMIDKNYYYVDKTLIIRDLLNTDAKVNLFTRPRRFGKTLTIQMLRTFFEKEIDRNGAVVDNSRYFNGTGLRKRESGIRVIWAGIRSFLCR